MTSARAVKEQKVRIHPAFTELISQLKTATFNDKGHPDKTRLSFDLGDTFLMGVHYLIGGAGEVGYAMWDEDYNLIASSSSNKSGGQIGYAIDMIRSCNHGGPRTVNIYTFGDFDITDEFCQSCRCWLSCLLPENT